MKQWLVTLAAMMFAGPVMAESAVQQTAYDFSFEAIDGSAMPLSAYKGKALLVVNTASECGFTSQYEGLEALWQAYKDKGLVVIGVPSNDFGGQEPGSNAEIKTFCESRFKVSFPLAGKTQVKGEGAHPFYVWAKETSGSAPSWNFTKYVINREGWMVEHFSSITGPGAAAMKKAVEKALTQGSEIKG